MRTQQFVRCHPANLSLNSVSVSPTYDSVFFFLVRLLSFSLTNVGRAFLNIIDSSFPVDHMLRTIFNRDTLKLSYSCLPNIKNTIDSHNKAQLKKSNTEAKKDCNCRNKANCPLKGNCREHNIVYQATVTTRENDNN